MSFIAELKSRNVVRVGIAYGVIGWLFAKVVDIAVLPFVNLSNDDDFFSGGLTEKNYLSPLTIEHGTIE